MADIVAADPLPVVLATVQADQRVLDLIGDPTAVSGLREAPWPHLVVRPGVGGSIPDLTAGLIEPEVAFEVWGHPDGRHGEKVLRDLAFTVLTVVRELAGADLPGGLVISEVNPTALPVSVPLTNGQRKWTFAVTVRTRHLG